MNDRKKRTIFDGGCALCFGVGVINGSEGPEVCPCCGGDGLNRPTCSWCAGTGRNVAEVPTSGLARLFGAPATKRGLVACVECKGSGKGPPRAETLPPEPPSPPERQSGRGVTPRPTPNPRPKEPPPPPKREPREFQFHVDLDSDFDKFAPGAIAKGFSAAATQSSIPPSGVEIPMPSVKPPKPDCAGRTFVEESDSIDGPWTLIPPGRTEGSKRYRRETTTTPREDGGIKVEQETTDLGPRWTNKAPTVPGMYWCRERGDIHEELAHVQRVVYWEPPGESIAYLNFRTGEKLRPLADIEWWSERVNQPPRFA